MRPESWTPPDDGPLLFDRDHTRWGACGDCGEPIVYLATHRCPPTIAPEPATHRHWFVVHRHGPWPRHKPHPGRWHVHVWWRHSHPDTTARPSLLSRLRTLRLRSPIVPAQRAPESNERTTR